MATYRIFETLDGAPDNTMVRTEQATEHWAEERHWDGSNHIGRSSHSQWHDQTLHKSRKGRYYLEHESHVQGEKDYASWMSPQDATRWLLENRHDLPDDLKKFEEEVSE
jgi:hypothetical protein